MTQYCVVVFIFTTNGYLYAIIHFAMIHTLHSHLVPFVTPCTPPPVSFPRANCVCIPSFQIPETRRCRVHNTALEVGPQVCDTAQQGTICYVCQKEEQSTNVFFGSTEALYIRHHINNAVNMPVLLLKLDCRLLYINPGSPHHRVSLAIMKASN